MDWYSHHEPTKFIKESIESSLCDYSDAYILVIENIVVTRTIGAANVDDQTRGKQEFTVYCSYTSCI